MSATLVLLESWPAAVRRPAGREPSWACGKVRHETRGQARAVARQHRHQRQACWRCCAGMVFRAYRCRAACEAWHTGHSWPGAHLWRVAS